MRCPSCGHENFPGADQCEACSQSLIQKPAMPSSKEVLRRTIMTETVWSAINKEKPVVLNMKDSVEKAVRAFQEHKQSCLLITDRNGKLAGIVSYRDILVKVAGRDKDFTKLTIDKIMTSRPETLREDDTVALAINKMSIGGFRHIPLVSDDGKPVGWISVKAVLRHLSAKSLTATSGA